MANAGPVGLYTFILCIMGHSSHIVEYKRFSILHHICRHSLVRWKPHCLWSTCWWKQSIEPSGTTWFSKRYAKCKDWNRWLWRTQGLNKNGLQCFLYKRVLQNHLFIYSLPSLLLLTRKNRIMLLGLHLYKSSLLLLERCS